MGVSYYKTVTQWSDGSYPGATNTEDDLAIIDTYITRLNGTGTALPGTGQSSTVHTLTTSAAQNVHTLDVSSGPVTITVDKLDSTGNLVASLTVRDPAGQVVATSTPIHPAAWTLSAALPADADPGTYSVEVRGMGWTGSGAADPGFTAYGSIGQYEVGVEMSAGAGTPTDPPGGDPTAPPTDPDTPTNPPTDNASDRDALSPITPLRVLDTRAPSSPTSGRLRAGRNLRLDLADAPAGTTAAVVNVVAVNPLDTGWLSLTPCTSVAPEDRTSSINFVPGSNIANSVIVPLTAKGELCIYASTTTHVVVDVTGWIGAAGDLTLDELGSTRVVDTREGLGLPRRLNANSTRVIDLSGVLAGSDIGAVAINVTAVRPSTRGYLAIDDCSVPAGTTSSLNVDAGEVRGNNGIFALGAGQRLCVTTTAATHLTIDVTGQFGAGDGLHFLAASPERVLDTRVRQPLAAGDSTTYSVPTATLGNGFTASPAAASVNVTAARHRATGFVTSWDCGTKPDTSALNTASRNATANGALVELSPSGRSCLFHSVGGHLIVDLAGWWV